MAIGGDPRRRARHARAWHPGRQKRPLPEMEIPRASSHRASGRRERHPRDALRREPGFQLHRHRVVDPHRYQCGQLSGQHERPLPGAGPDRRLVFCVARRARGTIPRGVTGVFVYRCAGRFFAVQLPEGWRFSG